jgi:hypothetical protein
LAPIDLPMDEERKRDWDIRLGIAGPLLTVSGILVGVWQFNAGERNKVELQYELVKQQDDVEFRRKLWLERLNAYRSVAELAGKIAANADDPKFKDYIRDFTAAYWGTMIFVEDDAVETAMKEFYFEVLDYQNGWSDLARLKIRADLLIKACRRSAEQREPKAQSEAPPGVQPQSPRAKENQT